MIIDSLKSKAYLRVKTDLSYSYRRYLVDIFFFNALANTADKLKIADLGGKKKNKRGEFDIAVFKHDVHYFNLDHASGPDFFCDLENLPVEDESYDCVILSEVIEHLKNPIRVLKEAHRILKNEGVLLLTAPFQFHIHKDPKDYQRLTDMWYEEHLKELGYKIVRLEFQGRFYTVVANSLKLYWNDRLRSEKGFRRKLFRILAPIISNIAYWIARKDNRDLSLFESQHTLGFGMEALKINEE